MSSFVGRQPELAQLRLLLQNRTRLVVLTGPGGSGKSRLAIEAARRAAELFDDDVHWVALAALRDPRLLTKTIATAFGVDDLLDYIGTRRMLLVLDNFEQIVQASPQLTDLLQACTDLCVVVTSRERLRIDGETEFAVAPLETTEAVELFSARSGLAADATITDLCQRLDNLPLAVELAAARTSVLSPAQILSRISDRLDLFRAGRAADPRQATIRAAIEWSCQLLSTMDTQLFTRLGVFEGGCRVDAAEQIAGADLEGLQSLVDKNLLQHSGERFSMLETIREYAVELFDRSPDADQVRAKHLAWCIAFLEQSQRELSRGQADMARMMAEEFDNIRSALRWTIATEQIDSALRLVRWRLFWQSVQSHSAEGREWVESLLAKADRAEPLLRARVMTTAADLRRVTGDISGAREILEQALVIEDELADDAARAATAYVLGRLELTAGNNERADAVTRAAIASAEAAGDDQARAEATAQLADICYRLGATTDAGEIANKALGLARDVGDSHAEGESWRVLAAVARDAGDCGHARRALSKSFALFERLADGYCRSMCLSVLGDIELREDRPAEASRCFREALDILRTLRQLRPAGDALWGMVAVLIASERFEPAARLQAAVARLHDGSEISLLVTSGNRRTAIEHDLAQHVDPDTLHRWRSAGEALDIDEAIALALNVDVHASVDSEEPTLSSVLRREGEYWTVSYDRATCRLRDSVGVRYLATLLMSPGRELHVLDLAGNLSARATQSDDAGPMLDERAKASYKSRLRELEEDLAEAESWADTGRTARIKEEIEFLTRELAGAMGLGGRDRKAASDAERARVNITRAIRAALGRIREHNPQLADHLDVTIHTGTYCSYTPDPRLPARWVVDLTGTGTTAKRPAVR